MLSRGVIHCIPCIPCIPFRGENVAKIVEIMRFFTNFGFFAYHSTIIWGLHTIQFSKNYAPVMLEELLKQENTCNGTKEKTDGCVRC